MMSLNITPELVVGALSIVGIVILVLVKYGLLTFGKVIDGSEKAKDPKTIYCPKCSDHEIVVINAALAVKEAKLTSTKLSQDIAAVKEDVREIKETLEARQVQDQAEFRRIREMLGSLSGYIKGIHDKDGE